MDKSNTIRGSVEADVSGFKRGMSEAEKATEKFREGAERSSRGLTALDSVLGGLGRSLPIVSAGVAGVAVAALGLAAGAVPATAEVGRMAAALGVSAEAMSRYRYAAKITGVENSALQSGLESLQGAIESDSAALRAMGVATRDATGEQRPMADVLLDVADKFKQYERGASEATLGQAVFGRSFDELQPLLERGADGLMELTAEASTFGVVVTDESAAAAQRFEEDLRRLQGVIPGLVQELVGPLIGALADVATEFTAARAAGMSFLEMLGGTLFNELDGPKSIEEKLADRRDGLKRLQSGNFFDISWGERLNPSFTPEQMQKEIYYLERLQKAQNSAARAAEDRGQASTEAGRAAADAAAEALRVEQTAERERERSARAASRAAASAERERSRAAAAGERERARAAAAARREAEATLKKLADMDRFIEDLADKEVRAAEQSVKALQARADALEDEIALYGLTEEQIAAVNVQRAAERLEVAKANGESAEMIRILEREVELRREMAASVGELARRRAEDAARRDFEEEGVRASEMIGQSLTDALMRSFENGGGFARNFADATKDLFNNMVLRPRVQAAMQPVAEYVNNTMSSWVQSYSANGGGGGAGMLGSISSYFNSGAGAAWGTEAMANAWGSLGGDSIEALIAGNSSNWGVSSSMGGNIAAGAGYLSAIYSMSQGNYASGIGAAIGTYILPGIGTAIGSMIGGMVDGAITQPTYHTGAAVEYGTNNRARALRHQDTVGDTRVWGGFSETDQKGGAVYADPLKALAKGATDSYERFMSQFGLSQQVSAYAAFGADGKDASRGQLRLYDADGNLLGANSDQLLRGKKYDKDAQKGFQQYAADVGLVLRDSLVAADLPGWVDSVLTSLGDNVSIDQLNAVMADLDVIQGKTLDSNETWRRATTGLADDFAALGVQMPESTAAFNELLMASGDLAGELYQLAPAFYELAGVVEAVFASISTTTAESVRDIEMAMLDKAGQYEYLDREIGVLQTDLAAAANPAEIQRLFEEANAKTMQAWGMLDESEKQRLGTAYIDRLHELEALAQERLSVLPEDYEPALAAADSQQVAAEQTAAAAESLSTAAVALTEAIARFGAGTDGGADALRGAAGELSSAASRLGGAASNLGGAARSFSAEVGVS